LISLASFESFSQTFVWEGTSSETWSDRYNWRVGGSTPLAGPTSANDVLIGHYTSPTYWPEITSNDACRHLEFIYDGHIDFGSSGVLSVRGDIVSNTTVTFTCFDLEEGRVIMNGTIDTDLDGFIGFNILEINCQGYSVNITEYSQVLIHEFIVITRGDFNTNMHLNGVVFVLISQYDSGQWRTAYFDWSGTGNLNGEIVSQQIFACDIKTYHYLSCPVDSGGIGYYNKANLHSCTDQVDYLYGPYVFPTGTVPDWIFYDESLSDPNFNGSSANFMYGREGNNYQQNGALNRVSNGQGFCGRFLPYTVSGEYRPFTFVGTMNNGNITCPNLTLTNNSEDADGLNLIGNPYPSPISWQAVYDDISYLKEVFVWENNGTEYGGSFLTYDASISSGTHDGIIPIGQGFFVLTGSNNYQFDFTNDHRVADTSPAVFRKAAPINSLKINLKGKNNKDVLMIYFSDDFSDEYNSDEDIFKMMNPQNSIYAIHPGHKVSIEKQSLPEKSREIALGIETFEAGVYSMELKNDNLFPGQYRVYVEDRTNKTWRELKYGGEDFQFYAKKGENNNRFFLHFYNLESNSSPLLATTSGNFSIINNGQLSVFVQEECKTKQMVTIHSVGGELLFGQDLFLDIGENKINSIPLDKGCYLITIANQWNTTTQRIISID
jgi:hypothetical protein